MKYFLVNSLFLVIADTLAALILYFLIEFDVLLLGLVLIRLSATVVVFPVGFGIAMLAFGRTPRTFLVSFVLNYFLCIVAAWYMKAGSDTLLKIFTDVHQDLLLYTGFYLPLVAAHGIIFGVSRYLRLEKLS